MDTFVFFLALVGAAVAGTLNPTPYDDPWERVCPIHQTFSRLESQHSNRKEDRTWTYTCKESPAKFGPVDRWSEEWTVMDAKVRHECGSNEVVAGFRSEHSNHHEDRKWQFMCRQLTFGTLTDCMWTGFWINDLDGDLNYDIPAGHMMVGLLSKHDNWQEDRRFKVKTCHYVDKTCV
ncbi:hemagglutinin/amebocyte aggregation factor-like [Lineus longissimus]|uniref:hemagglutinin/amebocyte aggregation factor-like n=1 Tax=Lineus longissimus TaxID=88925 RepID=UPI00315CDD69